MLCSKRQFRMFLHLCGISVLLNVGLLFLIKDNHIRHQIEKKYEVQNQAEGTLTKTVEHGFLRQKFSCKIDKYALSAIKRAKSASCKDELANVACLINEDILFPKKLPRFCPTKGDHNQGEYLGCYLKDRHFRYFSQLFIADFKVEKCASICLTQGGLFAGLQRSELKCWCASKLDQATRLEDVSCKTNCSKNQTGSCGRQDAVKVFSTGLPAMKGKKTSLVYKEDEVSGMKPVRIVFVFTVTGRAVRQIRRLLKAIYHVDHFYYIHVDSRQDFLYRELLKLEDIFSNVRLARERFATIWGGASRLQAHFSIMKTLLAMSNWTWDYYINLSETHYPLKIVTDQNFYECDEHLWLLGQRDLPKGISFDRGPDWLCLHRSFVEYAFTGTDPLLQGLKELYKYTMSPVESFFHVLLHNSEFCEAWVNENNHFMIWLSDKGCQCDWHKDEADWCGCSPLVIRQKDYDSTLKYQDKSLVFWSRKFDPMIDQAVVNSIDKLLGIAHKDTPALHHYWQNDLHNIDKPRSTTDVVTTFANSFIRRSAQLFSIPDTCLFTNFKLLETHLLNVDDKFNSYLVKFVAARTGTNTTHTLECQFSQIQHHKVLMENGIVKRLGRFEVGTKYDPKEEIFRNYPGFVGPNNLVMSLCYVWRSGAECHVTVLWVDPSGATVHRRDHQIGSKRSAGVYTLELKSPFQPGIWQVILQSELETLVELKFLVLPIATVIEIPLNEDDDNPGPSVNKSLNAKQVKFNAANKVKLTDNAKMSDKTFERDLLSWIDELTAQFWNAESICTLEDLGQDGPNIPLCSETTWSSMSPDPKSEIKLDGIGNIIK